MTNLRLPGQYDERLLASLGLQGPYYNWNRWYLPGVGRYLELDPLAVAGWPTSDAVQVSYLPLPWYGYADDNPLAYADPEGLITYSACLMRCIDKYKLDYWEVIPFSALPKSLLPPFRVPYPSQPLTTIGSTVQHYTGVPLRTGGRFLSRIATPLTLFEGFYDLTIIGECALWCKDSCK